MKAGIPSSEERTGQRLGAYGVAVFFALGPVVLLDLVLKIIRTLDHPPFPLQAIVPELCLHAGVMLLLAGFCRVQRLAVGAWAAVATWWVLGAHAYWFTTGGHVDHRMLGSLMAHPERRFAIILSEAPLWAVCGALAVIGVVTWHAVRRVGAPTRGGLGTTALQWIFGLALIWLSTYSFGMPAETGRPLLVRLFQPAGAQQAVEPKAMPAGIRAISQPQQPMNVVLVILESTGTRATSLGGQWNNTPVLASMAARGWQADRTYAVVPHTSKALVAILCGIPPAPGHGVVEARDGGIPTRCLADLLGSQGYQTAFFQSVFPNYESRRQLVKNMGYGEYFHERNLPTAGFEKVNYFGYDDRVMLETSNEWVRGAEGPFLATYLTSVSHHPYGVPSTWPIQKYVDDDADPSLNPWLNSVAFVDAFIGELHEQFEAAGLAENTVFVVVGDHGQALGEHGRRYHDDVVWDEGLVVPLVVNAPGLTHRRFPMPLSQLDIIPTILDLLGADIQGQPFGRSMGASEDPDRVLYATCWFDSMCAMRLQHEQKLVHHFGTRPDELYNLNLDPTESDNQADGVDRTEWRDDLLAWHGGVRQFYREGATLSQTAVVPIPAGLPPAEHTLGPYLDIRSVSPQSKSLLQYQTFRFSFEMDIRRLPPSASRLQFRWQTKNKKKQRQTYVPLGGVYPVAAWQEGMRVRDQVEFRVPKKRLGSVTLLLELIADDGKTMVSTPIAEVEVGVNPRYAK